MAKNGSYDLIPSQECEMIFISEHSSEERDEQVAVRVLIKMLSSHSPRETEGNPGKHVRTTYSDICALVPIRNP